MIAAQMHDRITSCNVVYYMACQPETVPMPYAHDI